MTNDTDATYLNGLEKILEVGVSRDDRTGVGTRGVFGMQQRYSLDETFPLLTSKRVYTRGVFEELLFFLTGRTDNRWLNERKVRIWDEWADEDGDLGPIYGYQWRHFGAPYLTQSERDAGIHPGGVDQIHSVLRSLKENPFSRRHIVSAWNPEQLDEMALPPCHTMFQFYVTPDDDGKPMGLSCQLYQRSADYFLGVPFNIASYAALTVLFADLLNLKPLEFVHTIGDAHLYNNHVDQVNTQLSRRNECAESPTLRITHPHSLDELLEDPSLFSSYSFENFEVSGYEPMPAISAPIAV